MSGKVIVVEYDEFMDLFVPAPPDEYEPTTKLQSLNFASVATKPESQVYQKLVDVLNQGWLLPNDMAVLSPTVSEKGAETTAGLYPRSDAEKAGKKTRWAYMELPIGCKREPVEDYLYEERSDDTCNDGLRQLKWDSAEVFEYQRRVHLFALYIDDKTAVINRWDRSGSVEVAPFNFVEHPELLGRFIWRFARMSAVQRGHDPTATRIAPDSAEYHFMKERAKPPKVVATSIGGPNEEASKEAGNDVDVVPGVIGDHARAAFAKTLKDDAACWRLRVDDVQKGARYFLVGHPHYVAYGLAGRGTQTFIAVDEADPQGPFVYLKDVWRITSLGLEQEGKILAHLNSKDDGGPVPFVPTLRCHGDVEGQITQCHHLWEKKNAGKTHRSPFKTHAHYRLVVNEVCLPLDDFENARELAEVIACCICAHGDAYERKGLIHRDISAGNVLIYPDATPDKNGDVYESRVGLLADWEIAERISENGSGTSASGRMGTWRFASANSLNLFRKGGFAVQDDMESFFHLLVYQAIRFLPSNCYNVPRFIELYFDDFVDYQGGYYVGADKMRSMRFGPVTTPISDRLMFFLSEPPSDLEAPAHEYPPYHPINSLIAGFLRIIKAHYHIHLPLEDPRTFEAPVTEPAKAAPTKTGVKKGTVYRRMLELKERGLPSFSPKPPMTPAEIEAEKARIEAEKARLKAERIRLEALAAKLASHDDMIVLFMDEYESEDWPAKDRVPDKSGRR
ncbi:hypothetical protein C8Q70DRAFT_1049473 [Cubamyces menziesii]|nr:hypothetical protein C8Q70DRAFT_1049473 [Cubamyces menziesii]